MLYAPINPADISTVEGTYGIAPTGPMPAVGGSEGVGEVVMAGSGVSLPVGSLVLPAVAGLGTWRSHLTLQESQLLPVPANLAPPVVGSDAGLLDPSAVAAATLAVAPSTAQRLLSDFEALQPGDWVMQNGGSSAVGQAVVQLARARGLRTLTTLRSGPFTHDVATLLQRLGGDIVVREELLASASMREVLKELPPVRLALNALSGPSATDMARMVAPGGTVVTYGGMSLKPMAPTTEDLVYRGVRMRGFWLTRWNQAQPRAVRVQALSELADLVRGGYLTAFTESVDIDDFSHALHLAQQPGRFRKVILNLNPPCRLANRFGPDATQQV